MPFPDHGGNIIRPVQDQVGPDQIDPMALHRQGMSIGTAPDRPGMLRFMAAQPAGQGLPPGTFTSIPVVAVRDRQAPTGKVEPKQSGVRMPLPERTDVLTKATSNIQDEFRLMANEV